MTRLDDLARIQEAIMAAADAIHPFTPGDIEFEFPPASPGASGYMASEITTPGRIANCVRSRACRRPIDPLTESELLGIIWAALVEPRELDLSVRS